MKKWTKTTTETHEIWIVRRGPYAWRAPNSCAACAGPALMLAPEEASALAGLTTRAVYVLVESGRVHFDQRPNGMLFVCLASLADATGGPVALRCSA